LRLLDGVEEDDDGQNGRSMIGLEETKKLRGYREPVGVVVRPSLEDLAVSGPEQCRAPRCAGRAAQQISHPGRGVVK